MSPTSRRRLRPARSSRMSKPMATAIPWLAFLANFVVPTAPCREESASMAFPASRWQRAVQGRGVPAQLAHRARSLDKYWGPKAENPQGDGARSWKDSVGPRGGGPVRRVDFAADVPIREVARLDKMAALSGRIFPIFARVILLQIRSDKAFADKNVRLAALTRSTRRRSRRRSIGGQGGAAVASSHLRARRRRACRGLQIPPTIRRNRRPLLAKSGFSTDKPLKNRHGELQRRLPGDYDIAGRSSPCGQKVGIEANLQVIEQPKYFELNRGNKLRRRPSYSWDNAVGDPEMFTGLPDCIRNCPLGLEGHGCRRPGDEAVRRHRL